MQADDHAAVQVGGIDASRASAKLAMDEGYSLIVYPVSAPCASHMRVVWFVENGAACVRAGRLRGDI